MYTGIQVYGYNVVPTTVVLLGDLTTPPTPSTSHIIQRKILENILPRTSARYL